jgi:hypothetical protein
MLHPLAPAHGGAAVAAAKLPVAGGKIKLGAPPSGGLHAGGHVAAWDWAPGDEWVTLASQQVGGCGGVGVWGGGWSVCVCACVCACVCVFVCVCVCVCVCV